MVKGFNSLIIYSIFRALSIIFAFSSSCLCPQQLDFLWQTLCETLSLLLWAVTFGRLLAYLVVDLLSIGCLASIVLFDVVDHRKLIVRLSSSSASSSIVACDQYHQHQTFSSLSAAPRPSALSSDIARHRRSSSSSISSFDVNIVIGIVVSSSISSSISSLISSLILFINIRQQHICRPHGFAFGLPLQLPHDRRIGSLPRIDFTYCQRALVDRALRLW